MNSQSILGMLTGQLDIKGGPAVTNIEPLKILDRRLSFIMLCRMFTDDEGDRLAWVKILNPSVQPEIKQRRVARDFDLNRYLYGVIDKTGKFRVPEPIHHSPEHRLIVTGHISGTVLQEKIESGARGRVSARTIQELERDCRLAGEWLRSFQGLTEGYCPGQSSGYELMKVKGAARIVEQTTSRLDQLIKEDPGMLVPTLAREIKHFLNSHLSAPGLGDTVVCSIHGDYFAGNLMVEGETIACLDFESATWGSPLFDPSYFVFQLETLQEKFRYRNAVVSQLVDAFLNGYGMELDHQRFWVQHPMTRILLVSHAISRLLSLANNSKQISARGLYRRLMARKLITRLKRHIHTHQESDSDGR